MNKRGNLSIEKSLKTILVVFVLAVIIIGAVKFNTLEKINDIVPGLENEQENIVEQDSIDVHESTLGNKISSDIISEYTFQKNIQFEIVEIKSNGIILQELNSPIHFSLVNGTSKKIDSNEDGFYDLELTPKIFNETYVSIDKENIFQEVDYSNPEEFKEENYYNKLLGIKPNLETLKDYDSRYRAEKHYNPKIEIENRTDYWQGYENYSASHDAPKIKDSYSWVDSLPIKKTDIPIKDYQVQESVLKKGFDYIPCGSLALYKAMNQLGTSVPFEQINDERSGGIRRGFLSIFSSQAKHITWPSEMREIPKKYGFEVRELTGAEANLENVRRLSTQNSVVIMHTENSLFAQHYQAYDTNSVKKMAKLNAGNTNFEQNMRSIEMDHPDWKIKHLYVISKKSS